MFSIDVYFYYIVLVSNICILYVDIQGSGLIIANTNYCTMYMYSPCLPIWFETVLIDKWIYIDDGVTFINTPKKGQHRSSLRQMGRKEKKVPIHAKITNNC
jgi:hypothetical protein